MDFTSCSTACIEAAGGLAIGGAGTGIAAGAGGGAGDAAMMELADTRLAGVAALLTGVTVSGASVGSGCFLGRPRFLPAPGFLLAALKFRAAVLAALAMVSSPGSSFVGGVIRSRVAYLRFTMSNLARPEPVPVGGGV